MRPLPGMFNVVDVDVPIPVTVTVAACVAGFTSHNVEPGCRTMKSDNRSLGTAPSRSRLSLEPVAEKTPSPGAEGTASTQPSSDCRLNNSVTNLAYCCPGF